LSVNRLLFAKSFDGAAGHGGIVRCSSTVFIFADHLRTWPTFRNGIGAAPPRRWHSMQRFSKMRPTPPAQVGSSSASFSHAGVVSTGSPEAGSGVLWVIGPPRLMAPSTGLDAPSV